MKNINFTDWQSLWLKKDIEEISRKINKFPIFNLVVLIDISIATLTLAFTGISIINDDKKFIIVIILSAIASVVVPLVAYLIYFCITRGKMRLAIINSSMKVKKYVDKFDNKICNRIMMASTLYENIVNINKDEEKYYYICEISYYINKCIYDFKSMQSMIKQIFDEDDDEKVAPQRLILVIRLILKLRDEIRTEILALKDLKGDEIENKIISYFIKKNKKYDKDLDTFITHIEVKLNMTVRE